MPLKIQLTLFLTSICQVARCQGNYMFCFRFVTFTPSTLYYSHAVECYLYRCLPTKLAQFICPTTWWIHTPITFLFHLFLLLQTFKRFSSHSDGKQAIDNQLVSYCRWCCGRRTWHSHSIMICWCISLLCEKSVKLFLIQKIEGPPCRLCRGKTHLKFILIQIIDTQSRKIHLVCRGLKNS